MTVAAEAVETGAGGNVGAGAVHVLTACPVAVTAVTNEAPFTGGLAEETDEALRVRVLDTFLRLPNGANAAWYELTACRHAGVTSAKAVGRARGIGTVDVYVSTPEGVPGQALLTELQAMFQKSREIAVDVQVKAPEAVEVNMTLTVKPAEGTAFEAAKAAVESELAGFFGGRLLGQSVKLAELYSRILCAGRGGELPHYASGGGHGDQRHRAASAGNSEYHGGSMSGKYEGYLQALLAPLGLYDLTGGRQQGGELAALGAALDGVDDRLALAEREGLLATAEGTGLERREALFQRKPAAVTPEERREAIAALLQISEDSLTPEAINDTLTGCGIRAKAEETAEGLRVIFPKTAGIPADFEQIQSIILDILPCHLAVEFYFRYLTWAECEAAEYTWSSVEAAGHTWESFQLAVPPEE